MKKNFPLRVALYTLLFLPLLSSCNKWEDDVNSLKKRVEALEKAQALANDNLSAMQQLISAFEATEYITDVTPLVENGVDKGYTIKFKQRAPITVYHGNAPRISVEQDTNQNWYWTYNDSWLYDSSGNKILATGITPRLKIENGRWMLSMDNGIGWSDAGQATGADGQDGVNSFITNLEDVEGSYTITFSNGQKLTFSKEKPFVDRVLTATDIPDPAFREWLIVAYDKNMDGLLQLSEIANLTWVSIPGRSSYYKINSITGIEHFHSLERLSADYTMLTSLNLSSNLSLKTLSAYHSLLLSSIDVSGCKQLETININYSTNLHTLDLSQNNMLNSVNITNNINLTSLILDSPLLTSLIFTHSDLLENLDISKCTALGRLHVTDLPSLSKIYVWNGFNTASTPLYYYIGAGVTVTFEVKP